MTRGSNQAKRARAQLEENAELLPSIAGIYQGIRTGANDIFIGFIESGDGSPLVRFVNDLGEAAIIEGSLLHPVVYGSDIQRYDIVQGVKYLLYPYHNGAVIAETELSRQYPQAYAYLNRYRDVLSQRVSINAGGLRWYELVRKRDETWLSRPKLLIRDLASQTAFAIDQTGDTFIVGGTAVVPVNPDVTLPLLAYLNSRLVTNYLAEITPSFKGGFQKFEPQHLQRLPVPNAVIGDDELALHLEELAIGILTSRAQGDAAAQARLENEVNRLLADELAAVH